jgi:hypothetical protein
MDTMPDSRDSEYVMINGKRESMLGALTLMPEMNVADLAGDGLGNLIQLFEKVGVQGVAQVILLGS